MTGVRLEADSAARFPARSREGIVEPGIEFAAPSSLTASSFPEEQHETLKTL